MAIDTREELGGALREAAEIEHGLMIQYLFPAVSMKKRLDEGLTGPQQRMVRSWEGTILRVAVEEMGHLGTVCNLLASIGEAPHFDRPNFPQRLGYYPFPFDLVPFGDEVLYRMLVFELPRGQELPAPPGSVLQRPATDVMARSVVPEELHFDYVGELYEKIAEGFRSIDPHELFIGPHEAQSSDDWSVDLDLHQVHDRPSALAAVQDIIEDGEGAAAARATSHYGRFLAIREEYAAAERFAAARAVVRNPRTRDHRDAQGAGTLLQNEGTRRVAELFNSVYGTVLLLLQHFFTLGAEDAAQRRALQAASSRLMSVGIRPLAEVLTEMPSGDPTASGRAGPTFEVYGDVSLSPFYEARWTVLLERLAAVVADARELGEDSPRIAATGETIDFVRRALSRIAP